HRLSADTGDIDVAVGTRRVVAGVAHDQVQRVGIVRFDPDFDLAGPGALLFDDTGNLDEEPLRGDGIGPAGELGGQRGAARGVDGSLDDVFIALRVRPIPGDEVRIDIVKALAVDPA